MSASPHGIKITRAADGQQTAVNGRFCFEDQFYGTTRCQGWQVWDMKTGKQFGADTLRIARHEIRSILDNEARMAAAAKQADHAAKVRAARLAATRLPTIR